MQLSRRSNEVFPPAKSGGDDIARLEFLGTRFDNLADGTAIINTNVNGEGADSTGIVFFIPAPPR
jgi:hypothetical protein